MDFDFIDFQIWFAQSQRKFDRMRSFNDDDWVLRSAAWLQQI